VISWVGDGVEAGEVEDGQVHGLEEDPLVTYHLGKDLDGSSVEVLVGGSLVGLGVIDG